MSGKGTISLILSFICAVNALVASTRYALYDASLYWHWLFLLLFSVSYFAGNYFYLKRGSVSTVRQLCVVNIIGTIVFSMLSLTKQQELTECGRSGYLISYLIILVTCAVLFAAEIMFIFRNVSAKRERRALPKEMIVLLVLTGTIAAIHSGSEPRWDSAYLFHYISETSAPNLFNLQALQFCGHLSMGYIAVNMILGYLLGNLALGMTVGQIFLYLMSVWCMYGIIKKILLGKSEVCYALLTSVYAFSPFVLGLVNYNYWDYWTTVLFPVIIYTAMEQQWVFHFAVAFLFIYTKETAFLSYAFWCMGLVLFDARLRDRGIPVRRRIKGLATDRKYIAMLVLGISWLVMWGLLPHWNGEGNLSFDIAYMIKKLKVFYLFNFNWMLSILSLLFCVKLRGGY